MADMSTTHRTTRDRLAAPARTNASLKSSAHLPPPTPSPRTYILVNDNPRTSISSMSTLSTLSSLSSKRSSLFSTRSDSPRSSISSTSSSSTSYYTVAPTYEYVPTLTKTPWEQDRHSRFHAPLVHFSVLPARYFKRLPSRVYDCIVEQLEAVHLGRGSRSCATCLTRDLCSLSLTSRNWNKAATKALYGTIRVPVQETQGQLKLLKGQKNRVKALLRLLRESPEKAHLVRALVVPELPGLVTSKEKEEIVEGLAALITACPYLERFEGFPVTYKHVSDPVVKALASRKRLKEQVWVIGENKARFKIGSSLSHGQISSFLQIHDNWTGLETLVLHAQNNAIFDRGIFVAIFKRLPSLKHLLVSGFDSPDFHDGTLQILPPLHSLRLQNLHGVTERGLATWSETLAARSLRSLSLVNIELMSLLSITKLWSHLRNLRRFTLVQESSPEMPPGTAGLHPPDIGSSSLQYLHWDILVPGATHDLLATAISTGAFPSLRRVRVPNDPDGLIQSLCKPLPNIVLHADEGYNSDESLAASEHRYTRSMRVARQAAQQRIEEARRSAAMKVVVEEDGVVQHTYTIKAYMGRLGSRVEYVLEPDVEGSDAPVVEIPDLFAGGGKKGEVRVCTGRWNERCAEGKRWWGHAPRVAGGSPGLREFF